jgi:endonuclease-8
MHKSWKTQPQMHDAREYKFYIICLIWSDKTWVCLQDDPRTRLALFTDTHVIVQFNGPILQFSEDNPLQHESISRLGPDALKPDFDTKEAKKRLKERTEMKLADLLLDQSFIAGVGNKYKSEILFLLKVWPFRLARNLSSSEQEKLLQRTREVLTAGYLNAGRTRPQQQGESDKWNFRHWVFRRALILFFYFSLSNSERS